MGVDFRPSGPGKGGETSRGGGGGEQHLSTTSIYFKFDPFRLPLILVWLRAQKGGSFSNSELGTSAFP